MDLFHQPLKTLLFRLSIGLAIVVCIGIVLSKKIGNPNSPKDTQIPTTVQTTDTPSLDVAQLRQLPEVLTSDSTEETRKAQTQNRNKQKNTFIQTSIPTTTYTTVTNYENLEDQTSHAQARALVSESSATAEAIASN